MKVSFFILLLLVSVTVQGQLIFNRTFYGPSGSNQTAYSSTVDNAGNIYVAGHYKYTNPFHWLTLMKLDSVGNLLWSKASDESWSGRKILCSQDENLTFLGLRNDLLTQFQQILFSKCDTAGNIIWSHIYADTLRLGPTNFIELPEQGFILTAASGQDFTSGPGETTIRAALIRTDTAGTILWSKSYGADSMGFIPRSVVETQDGGFIVGGDISYYSHPTQGDYDIFIFKTDSLGSMQWAKQFGGINTDNLTQLIRLSNGKYAFGGKSNSFIGSGIWPPFKQLFFQFDNTGNKIFCKQYVQGNFSDACNGLIETFSGNIILTGEGTTKMTDVNGNPILWNGLGINSSIFRLPGQSFILTSDYGNNTCVRIIKTDSLLSPPCNSFNYNPPLQVTIIDDFLPLILNEVIFAPADSVLNSALFDFNLSDSLYCLTATNIVQHELNHDIFVFHNPFIDYISLVNNSNLIIDQLDIYDVTGRIIKASNYSNESLNLSYLKPGVYFIKIVSKDKSIIQIFKICKIN